ncbi:dihydrolipoyl dehydrogenase family protein [Desulfohalovibrio reitneri]|uniref:dihydrolipoyl dehydrogenase family protein n=1 Tax=Desulfohalovibrio reitneri TaxID=1307759 RepID=UPI0004A7467C|nr:FAD-dependent oxidoreductase [Desulfohalovibrio reitneri]
MGEKFDYDIGVIGGGAAGLTVTAGAAQLGAKTVLIEKEPKLGGDCLHYGCVPSKTLIRTARAYHEMKRAERYGLPRVIPEKVDFRRVAERIQSVIDTIQKHDSPERFCRLGAEVRFGRARFTDEHQVELEDGQRVSAKRWVLATGSEPAVPPISGLREAGCLTNKDIFSLEALPPSLIVLGAGPIACEMAQAFQRLGCQVSVIQRSGQILTKEDPDMASIVLESLEREGVKFHLGTEIRSVRVAGGHKEVVFAKNGREWTVKGHEILAALGRDIATDGLGLNNAGVKHSRKGIEVDAKMRTSQKHIFACGDATGKYLFTHAAGYEGGIVVSNAVFRLPRKADYTWLPWCTYTQPELASIGRNEAALKRDGVEYEVWTEDFAENDRAQAEGEGRGTLKLLLDGSENPLGVQIAGPGAGDLVGEWVAALNGKVKFSTLAGAVHPYPTLAEINKKVAGSVFSRKVFSDTVKKGLHFLFHYKGRACEMPEEAEEGGRG